MTWSRLVRTVAPEGEDAQVLSWDQAKAHLRLSDDQDRDDVCQMILAIQGELEGPAGIGLALLPQTWQLTLDAFPSGSIPLMISPVRAITSVIYVATDGVSTTLAADQYQLAKDQALATLQPAYGLSWPATRAQAAAVRVTFTAGYDDADAVPPELVLAIKMALRADYDGDERSPRVRDILARYGGAQFAPA